ncbi:MAG TPA: cation-transporting P-type ATPase [Mariprofundaceae bacterium]|nr:cation-transporting P-type ATPase [Mariprofundaceae bacterium]
MRAQMNEHWHHLPASEVLDLLASDPAKGLDSLEITERQGAFGPNRLSPRRERGPLLLFLQQFNQPLVYILLIAGLITVGMQKWVDASVIFGVVFINAVIGSLQESRALKAIEALRRSMTSVATVLRGGVRLRIDAGELVPGDIVLLQSGDKVPADLRLLDARGLRVDESALTGESVPVEKQPEAMAHDALLADRRNMAYSSTLVTFGTGRGVVVATGDATEIGRISELLASTEVLATPLTRRLARFSGILLYAILALAAVTFVVGILHGESWFEMFMAAVALAVSAIPEGLPAVLTIALAIGVGRMARSHAIIRHLPAVETLGSTTVICSDKTGTLTQNQMTVQQVHAGGRMYRVSGVGYAPDGRFSHEGADFDAAQHPVLRDCLAAGVLCNDSRLHLVDGHWHMEGDPTEAALTTAAHKAGIDPEGLRADWRRLDALAFESQQQYMATLHVHAASGERRIYIKGSAEAILARCGDALGEDGGRAVLDAGAWHGREEAMAAEGMRVLAFAFKTVPATMAGVTHEDVASGLTLLGLQGMIDPPRPEAVAAVRACRSAGIRVKMITGDHAVTAAAIARAIGLIGSEEGAVQVLGGRELSALPDQELIELAARTPVFARVTPDQKLRLVEALQAKGHVVAMTGDGVNDAPALRRADIGVAMGVGGTEVAKEAADMVLADDNFASIEAAVEEGRAVYDNLVKFIAWVLPTNLGEALMILVAIFGGLTLPILPVQILWINMTTTVFLGLMLAFEPKEAGIMERPPRDPASPILTGELMGRILLVGVLLFAGAFGLYAWRLGQGAGEAAARTDAVNALVFGEMFYLFNCRSLRDSMFRIGISSNRWLLAGVAGMALAQLAFTYVPWMNRAFASAPVGWIDWGLAVVVGVAVYGSVGTEKWLRRSGRDKIRERAQ